MILFEKVIRDYTQDSIALSESYRKEPNTTNIRQCIALFRKTMKRLKGRRLNHPPLFVWHGVNSTCWRFEETRLLYMLHHLLLNDAKISFKNGDFKTAKSSLVEALQTIEQIMHNKWAATPYVRSMVELQDRYQLSKLFATKGLYWYNAHSFKNTHQAIKIAYQLTEISNRLWKTTQNLNFEEKLLCEYHRAKSDSSENFTEKLSHITAAHNIMPQHVEEAFNTVTHLNNTVHYVKPFEVVCATLTVESALALCGTLRSP
jgi:hypothetical protein